jgi:hypothetical protein
MDSVELIETPTFTMQITALLSDEEYRRFQRDLVGSPSRGALIKGGGAYARFALQFVRAVRPGVRGSFITGPHGKPNPVALCIFEEFGNET